MIRNLFAAATLMLVPFARATATPPPDAALELFRDAPEMFSDEALHAVAVAVVLDDEVVAQAPADPQSRKRYWQTYAWLAASTIYDVESTFYLMRRCEECREANPIVRPIIDRGRFATYAYSAAVNAIVMYIARRMFDRNDDRWSFAPRALTIVHGVAGTWNMVSATRPAD